MKKNMTIVDGNSRKPYEKPSTTLVELVHTSQLLSGSPVTRNLNIVYDDDEWPVDPVTNQPYKPW